MITKRIKNLIFISLLLNIFHGIEVIVSGFYFKEPHFYLITKLFNTISEAFYFGSHLVFWFAVICLYLIFYSDKTRNLVLGLYGTIFVTEAHHFVKAILTASYYPGAITSIFFPILGYLYWKEFLSNVVSSSKKKV